MAGDWIQLRTNIDRDPRVVRIVSALCPHDVRNASAECPQSVRTMSEGRPDLSRASATTMVVGALARFWSLADEFSVDGLLDGFTAQMLDDHVGIPGFSSALEGVGWLVVAEGPALQVPRFEEHSSGGAKRRIEDAKRKKAARRASAECPQDVRTMSAERPHDVRNASATRPHRRGPTEEKRREDHQTPPTPRDGGSREGGGVSEPDSEPASGPDPAEVEALLVSVGAGAGQNGALRASDARCEARAESGDFDALAAEILARAQRASGHADFARRRSHLTVRNALARGEITFEQACLVVDRLGAETRAAETKSQALANVFSDFSAVAYFLSESWTAPTPSEPKKSTRPDDSWDPTIPVEKTQAMLDAYRRAEETAAPPPQNLRFAVRRGGAAG